MHLRSLRILYLLLAGVASIAVVATLAYPEIGFIRDFGVNIATESLAIIVTLAFVRTILERQERARRLRASVGAVRKGRRGLDVLVSTWSDLVKGSLPALPAERPTTDDELFASHYTEHLTRLDPRAERRVAAVASTGRGPGAGAGAGRGVGAGAGAGAAAGAVVAPGADERTWAEWAAERLRADVASLAEIARSYGAVLDPDYVEVLEALVDDPFIAFFLELVDDRADARRWRFEMNLNRGLREAHFRSLAAAIEVHNRVAQEAAEYRSRSLLPRAAALDIDLPEAEDLLLDTRLDAAFWRSPPTPGELRLPDPPR